MDWHQIAESIRAHQTTLHEQCQGQRFVSHTSDLLLFQALTKECMTAWQMTPTEISRLPDETNTLQFECRRGHQHKHIHQAVQSFLAYAKDQYLTHLEHTGYSSGESAEIVKNVLSEIRMIQDLEAAIPKKTFVTNDKCHLFYVDASVGHHVRIHITVTRGIATTFSGTMQVIAHQFPIRSSDETADEILARITSFAL